VKCKEILVIEAHEQFDTEAATAVFATLLASAESAEALPV